MREILAAHAHDMWSGWMQYMFSKSTINKDGTMTIPAWAVSRWTRQADTKYSNLPEEEKESDLKEADRILKIIQSPHKSLNSTTKNVIDTESLEEYVKRFETTDLKINIKRGEYTIHGNIWPFRYIANLNGIPGKYKQCTNCWPRHYNIRDCILCDNC